ncbi:hypothetical protein [Nocardioides sp. WS12]|uniref:DUF7065 domain-containing protein n=1 Tax=Nocardioides sp. WS12 TaxID=2486272 RepID=UPI0015FC120A|nr:hypothetical protein [Nocardioides sp. WS12]
MITVKDEELHAPGDHPNWQESFYFNWSSDDGRSFGLTRIGLNHAAGTADAVMVMLHDGAAELVYAAVGEPIPARVLETSLAEGLTIGRLTYTMLDPLGSWRIELAGRQHVELTWTAFTPAVDFHESFPGDVEDLQAHFEQSGHVAGSVVVGTHVADVKGLGQRDKSWGVRDWSGINGWEWIAGQFNENLSFNATLTDVNNVRSPAGFFFHDGTAHIVCGVRIEYTGGHCPETVKIDITVDGDRTYVVTGKARARVPLYKKGLFIEETQFGFECEIDGVRHEGVGVVEHAFHTGPAALVSRLPRLLKVVAQARKDSK